MMPVAVTPDELDRFARLLDRQDDHLGALARLCDTRCRDVRGLDTDDTGLPEAIDTLGRRHTDLLVRCRVALAETARSTTAAARAYRASDLAGSAALDRLAQWVTPVAGADAGSAPAGVPERARPAAVGAAGPDGRRLAHRVASARQRLDEYEELWFRITGDSLDAQIVAPLAGRVSRLAALAGSYEDLAAGAYAVAWEVRAGVGRLLPGWRTAAGEEFAGYAHRCHHGLGGLGDLDRAIAAELRHAYAGAAVIASTILDLADELVGKVLGPLRSLVYPDTTLRIWLVPAHTREMYAVIRGGLDILADVAERRRALRERYDALRRRLDEWSGTLARAGSGGPGGLRGWPIHRYDEFEADAGWDPVSGTERLALLPLSGTDGGR